MTKNHVPLNERLQNRINKLSAKIQHGDYWTKAKYYPKCIYCGITNVQCSMGGHHKDCEVPGIEKEIAYYKSLMKKGD